MSSPPPLPIEPPRYSLGSILVVISMASVLLAIVRALPRSEESQAFVRLFGALAVFLLIALAPRIVQMGRIKFELRQRRRRLEAWTKERRREHRAASDAQRDGDSPPGG